MNVIEIKEKLNNLINNIKLNNSVVIEKESNNTYLLEEIDEIIEEYIKLLKMKHKKKLPFYISNKDRESIDISQTPISISKFSYILNNDINDNIMKKIRGSEITDWLMSKGYLKGNLGVKEVTEEGIKIGIFKECRLGKEGEKYSVNLYNTQAQKFIIDNLGEICSYINNKKIKST
ncbi:hypothetical protein K5I20_08075 [Fusobacterium nucleatum]|jgi:hypothetical protein|nr:hypothetical protein [Fusobacterium nucleatum]MCG6841264.1 hypothetical protein [Fusobacterium nucleatum]